MESNNLEHHKRYEYCYSRLQYRNSKLPTAVKVYTVANESCNLLVFGVPKINLLNELKRSLEKYGPIVSLKTVTDTFVRSVSQTNFEIEQFTDVYHAKFEKLEHARRAKKFFDAKNFYGGIIHISYAPEFESQDDVRQKLMQRKKEVKFRIKLHSKRENQDKDENETTTKHFKFDSSEHNTLESNKVKYSRQTTLV